MYHRHRTVVPSRHHQRIIGSSLHRSNHDDAIVNYVALSGFHTFLYFHRVKITAREDITFTQWIKPVLITYLLKNTTWCFTAENVILVNMYTP